ncbi:EAL domain-containing protein [Aliarcobacter butzleri]|uniref:EAL domain-containing protein n=1 Tax=Aliarcobacter butzleri TaxID=28197 RepID=UPI00345030B2
MPKNEFLKIDDKDKYLSEINNTQELLVFAIELKDFSFFANLTNDDYYEKTISHVKNEIKSRLKNNNCFIYRNKKILVFYEINDNERRSKYIKRIKRRFKRIILKKNTFFKFSSLEFILGIAIGKKNTVIKKSIIALDYAKKHNLKNKMYSLHLLKILKKEFIEKTDYKLIKKIVLRKNIVPFYQKIIDNETRSILKYESLARLFFGKEILTPDKFLDKIRHLRLYEFFTRNIINIVFNDVYVLKKIKAASINITPEDVNNRKTLILIEKLLKKHSGENITFEITETIGVDDYFNLINFTKMIKKYKAKISIDDFGSGHSGYEHLIRLDVDFIKIDGKFIKMIKESEKTKSLIKGLCQFAKAHNIKVIAEYVEDEEIFLIVKELGVDYSQGYYFGKPIGIC